MTLLGELYNSLDWLTVPDAARQLSRIFGEDISEASVLLMALQRRLKLSVRFVNPVEARPVKSIPSEEWMYEEFPLVASYRSCEVASPSEANWMTFGLNADCGIFYRSDTDSTEHITGVWDLPMIGNEKSRVEDEYQQLTTKHDVLLDCNAAGPCVLVESPEGQMYVLQELIGPTPYKMTMRVGENMSERVVPEGMTEEAYYPAQCLPDDSVLVVRASELTALQERFGKKQGQKKAGKMTVPRPKWFTVDQLAEEWRVSAWKINHFVETGQLTRSERFYSKKSNCDVFHALSAGAWSDVNKDEMSYQELHDDLCEVFTDGEKQYYIMLEDVERFEEEHGLTGGGVREEQITTPTPSVEKFPADQGGKPEGEEAPANAPEPTGDGYTKTNEKLEAACGMAMNTIKKKAAIAGIPIEKDSEGQNMIKDTDIVRIRAQYPKYSRQQKK
jgi:hypothetical protein